LNDNAGAANSLSANPFVGLRPFRSDEALLFFGRREQIAELLDRLHQTHFLAVIGSSGCGKSSLNQAGLIPALRGGFLVGDRDQWIEVTMTPGNSPLVRLARQFGITEMDLREGSAPAIVEKLQAQAGASERNCFLLIDQFEELFRFAGTTGQQEAAADFVSIMLALAEQRDFPVFVALTMRSDFLGDCDRFYGLSEALNRGLYLVPRLSRKQRREAIEGPIRLFHESITPQLVDRVLNDAGDEHDQLPVMEHALMRTWENWLTAGGKGPVDLSHYVAAGTARDALSRDADSALRGMTAGELALTETLFKGLTDTDASNRRIRRPARLSELALVSGRPVQEIRDIIDRFRTGGRSFLNVQEEPETNDGIVDISHESLIRQWAALRKWVDEEAESKRVYLDLVNAVQRRRALLHDADLQVALDWRQKNRPTEAWARRYSALFPQVIEFLDASQAQKNREEAEKARAAMESLRRTRQTVAVVSCLLVIAMLAAAFAFGQWKEAARQKQQAVNQTILANGATRQATTALKSAEEASAKLAQANVGLKIEKERADKNAEESQANSREAENQRTAAIDERAKAVDNARIAQLNATRAEANAGIADQERTKAEESATQAKSEREKAVAASNRATEASRSANLLLAQALVQYAGSLVDNGRNEEALACLSRALQVDQDSRNARSWIFDLLLRGGFRQVGSGAPVEPFIHEPWDLHSRALSAAYSSDGRWIAVGSWDHTARIWDARTHAPIGVPLQHPGIVNSVAFSRNGLLLTTSENTARIFDAATGKTLRSIDLKAPARSAGFSPSGSQVLTASLEKEGARLWNQINGSDFRFPLSAPAEWAAFCQDPGQKLIVTTSWDKAAQVWDISGKLLASVGPPGKVHSAQFSSDCKRIVTAAVDNTAQVWEWEHGRPVGAALQHGAPVNAAAFSPDGLRIVTASDDKTARVWDASTGAAVGAPLNHLDRVMSVAFSPDGKRVVTASYDGKVRVWDVWFDFDDAMLLANLAEALSGYKSAGLPDRLVKTNNTEREQELKTIREAASSVPLQAASTASFVRWFFSL
jgi:hypothetical protein